MKNRLFTVIFLIVLMVTTSTNAKAISSIFPIQRALVYVKLDTPEDLSRFTSTQLPMYAMIDGGLLTGADLNDQQMLSEAGLSFQMLDPDLRAGIYYLAETRSSRPIPDFSVYGQVLLNIDNSVLLRMDTSQVDTLAQAGAELSRITLTPKPLPMAQSEAVFPDQVEHDPLIQGMIDQVIPDTVRTYDRQLAGELPVWVDGDWYTIPSRYTYSGTPIQKTTSYVGQHMADLGLGVEYHTWGGASYPNVIGEIPGLVNPDDIYIIGAHIDDVQGTPGADDNASGSVATLIAADILSHYQWGCTLRFAFWTGEEQGLDGSYAYAQRAYQSGENILGYLNLDMIAWNTPNSAPGIDLYYSNSVPGTYEFAQLYSDVVSAYSLNLIPELGTGVSGSDHYSFWQFGYKSILAIEDNNDFNPYYHGAGDTPAHTDLAYFTDFVKASIASYVYKSGCLIPNQGYLDGHVTMSDGVTPISGANLTAVDSQGQLHSITTDATGYYTQTLLADTYTVTASAYGYLPSTIDGISVITDTITTLNFALNTAPTYVISGTITERDTGAPLFAMISFEDSPVTVWSDPSSGFYRAELSQGSYIMQVSSDRHRTQERVITLDQNQTQDFVLEPLPCILLVDDDNDDPDTSLYYTAALDTLEYEYDVFTTAGENGPDFTDLQGYNMVFWFSGDTYGGTAGPNAADETNLAAYLENGGKLFLDSQDYLNDMGLTAFGQTYLGIGSYSNNAGNTSWIIGTTGDPIGDELGPFYLRYPGGFSARGDIVNDGIGASVAFRSISPSKNLDVDKDEGDWQTVFFGTSWVPIYNSNPANGMAVLQRIIDFYGGCTPPLDDPITGLGASNDSPTEFGNLTTLTATIETGTNVVYEWNFGDNSTGTGSMTTHLYPTVGTYTATVTATNSVNSETAFTVINIDVPISALVAMNDGPTELGKPTYFSTTIITGTRITYTWEFGDGNFGSGATTSHEYPDVGTYTATVTATNSINSEEATTTVIVDVPITGLEASNDSPTYLGDTTHFTATVKAGTGAKYLWDFGDGKTGFGENPMHEYLNWGSYTASVTAINSINSEMTTTLVTIMEPACMAVNLVDFTWEPLNPLSGELISFTGSASGSEPITYTWDFGDSVSGIGITSTHTYDKDGDYPVMLTATNACGEDSVEHILTVTTSCEGVTNLSFTWTPVETFIGNLITFSSTASGTKPIYFQWDFGDHYSSTGDVVTHTYTYSDIYTVTVNATNTCSDVLVSKDISIMQLKWRYLLPVVKK